LKQVTLNNDYCNIARVGEQPAVTHLLGSDKERTGHLLGSDKERTGHCALRAV